MTLDSTSHHRYSPSTISLLSINQHHLILSYLTRHSSLFLSNFLTYYITLDVFLCLLCVCFWLIVFISASKLSNTVVKHLCGRVKIRWLFGKRVPPLLSDTQYEYMCVCKAWLVKRCGSSLRYQERGGGGGVVCQ